MALYSDKDDGRQTTDDGRQTTDHRPRTTDHRPRTTDFSSIGPLYLLTPWSVVCGPWSPLWSMNYSGTITSLSTQFHILQAFPFVPGTFFPFVSPSPISFCQSGCCVNTSWRNK